jgi:tRNA1Val (adenine37-N6)-methyltransferase
MRFFRFKQFQITDERSAMKVGTDAVILGAWAQGNNPQSILDIGCGSGLISVMLAQRYAKAKIYGIEIDADAVKDARFNFQHAAWNKNLHIVHQDIQSYQPSQKFDFIVSNPPFFKDSLFPDKVNRAGARHEQSLSIDELLDSVARLLEDYGVFSIVFPYDREGELIAKAEKLALFPMRILRTRNKPEAIIKRSFIEFSFTKKHDISYETFGIRNNDNVYSKEYQSLTSEFYLNF